MPGGGGGQGEFGCPNDARMGLCWLRIWFSYTIGLALMAVWTKALPLTPSCPSPLPEFISHPEYVRKLPVTLSSAMIFDRLSVFLHHLQLDTQDDRDSKFL